MSAKLTKLEWDFLKFHDEHPEVYELLKRFALEALAAGRKKLSIALLAERVRWETSVVGGKEFKLNNNHRSFYARMFMDDHPQYEGFFRTRQQKGLAR